MNDHKPNLILYIVNFKKPIPINERTQRTLKQGAYTNASDPEDAYSRFKKHLSDNLFDELEWVLFKLDLNMVPVLEFNYKLPSENLVENMLQYAEGKSVLNQDVEREGIVVRGLDKEFSFK